MDTQGNVRLDTVEAEVAVLRQLVWRLIQRVPGGVEDARSALRVMLPGNRRQAGTAAVSAAALLSRLPIGTLSPGQELPEGPVPHGRPDCPAPDPKACPACGPGMLLTVLVEEDPQLLAIGARRHLLRCLGCRHEESRIVGSPRG